MAVLDKDEEESFAMSHPRGEQCRVVQVQCGFMHTLVLMQAKGRLIVAGTGVWPYSTSSKNV